MEERLPGLSFISAMPLYVPSRTRTVNQPIHIVMETLENMIRNLADKLDQILGKTQLQEVPVRVDTKNHPNAYKMNRHHHISE